MSIIPHDPECHVDESIIVCGYEVEDSKVANLLQLIQENFPFTKSMFKEGVTEVDVEILREKPRAEANQKQIPAKQHSTQVLDESKVASIVLDILKPQIQRIDGDVAAAISAMKEISSSALAYQYSVAGVVEAMLKTFKEEILSSIGNGYTQPPAQTEQSTPKPADGSKPPSPVG